MKSSDKRLILITLMVVTGVAALACFAVFVCSPRHYEFLGIVSGLGVGFLVLVSFAAFTSLDHPLWKFPALTGMAISALFMILHPILLIMAINTNVGALRESIARIDGTGFTLAGLLCLIPFVMAPNIKFFGRLLQIAVIFSYGLIFVFFQIIIWDADGLLDKIHGVEKLIFALFAFAIAGTIAVAILNKFLGIKIKAPVTYTSSTLHLQCPRCSTFQDFPEGESVCRVCKLKFKIEIEEPVCPTCGYNLHHLTSARCPECGTTLSAPDSAGGSPATIDTGPTEQTPGRAGG